jgi:hypothetical protein
LFRNYDIQGEYRVINHSSKWKLERQKMVSLAGFCMENIVSKSTKLKARILYKVYILTALEETIVITANK